MTETPKKKVRVLFRQYKGGEGIALLPDENAVPGNTDLCVAFSAVGGFLAVDPKEVRKNTSPATKILEKMMTKKIEDNHPFTVERLDSLPSSAAAARKDDPNSYLQFDRLKNQLP